jgi:hypothetical protein
MLVECLERLLTTCPVHLREMGCLREMLGIRRRRRRFRQAWASHCQRSRDTILSAARRCPARRKAVVLGSGWLHDVPLEELARDFREVYLIDLFHPFLVRWRVRRHRNVQLVAADVTGTLEQVWCAGLEPRFSLPASRPALGLDEAEIDLTVSLNLLSQLPCMPERYLLQARKHRKDEILVYCRDVVSAHLDTLQRLPGVVTLLTDVELRTIDVHGTELRREETLYGVPLPWAGETWDWALVPTQPGSGQPGEILKVVAIEDIKQAIRTC